MNYADEEYYKNEYLCGKEAVINAAFDFYARSATAEIKRFTGRNVDEDNIPDCVKNCCCELSAGQSAMRAENNRKRIITILFVRLFING